MSLYFLFWYIVVFSKINLISTVNFICNFQNLIIDILTFSAMILIFLTSLVISDSYLYSIAKGVNPVISLLMLLYVNCAVGNNVI